MTDASSDRWVLSIDFGTTATAGAMSVSDGEEVVEIDNAPRMPSMVCWKEASNGTPGRLLLGEEAENEAVLAPQCLERCPKRKVGQEFILLGSQRVRVTDAVAQIFTHVLAEASRRQGGHAPAELGLTHPARWGERRLAKLREAARSAGFDQPLLVSEPVGAAVYFAKQQLRPGDHVAVYDLGGGTFDTAVLQRTDDGFEVVGMPGGRDDLGGEDFDDRLYHSLGRRLDSEQWQTLVSADSDQVWQRANYDFRKDVRRAKERLSKQPDATVRTPIPGQPDMRVSVSEFESLIREDIERTVEELERTIEAAGQTIAGLSAIYLAGGSSRIPLVSRRIEERLGKTPSVFGDPKAVIALGATRAIIRAHPRDANGAESDAEMDRDGATRESVATPPKATSARAVAAGAAAVGGGLAVITSAITHTPVVRQTHLFYRIPVAVMSVGVILLIIFGLRSHRRVALLGATGLALALLGVTFLMSLPPGPLPSTVGFCVGACCAAVAAAGAALAWLAYPEAPKPSGEPSRPTRSRTSRAALAIAGPLIVIGSLFVLPEWTNMGGTTWHNWDHDAILRYPSTIVLLCGVMIALAVRGIRDNGERLLVVAAGVACLMLGEAVPLIFPGVSDWGAGRWLRIVGAVVAVVGLAVTAVTRRDVAASRADG